MQLHFSSFSKGDAEKNMDFTMSMCYNVEQYQGSGE